MHSPSLNRCTCTLCTLSHFKFYSANPVYKKCDYTSADSIVHCCINNECINYENNSVQLISLAHPIINSIFYQTITPSVIPYTLQWIHIIQFIHQSIHQKKNQIVNWKHVCVHSTDHQYQDPPTANHSLTHSIIQCIDRLTWQSTLQCLSNHLEEGINVIY